MQVFSVNATGAIKVINAAQEAGCEGILQVSSAELYGDWTGGDSIIAQSNRIDEEVPVTPHSTYGAAKAAVDFFCQSAWRERLTPVIALRQFNCVGERETHPYVIPEIISQLAQGHIVKLGNNSFRDFQYAGDAVRMAVELLEKGEYGEVYNMGSEDGVQIYDLAVMLGELMGWGRERPVVIQTDPDRVRPWEIWHLQSDNSKLYSAIKYRPQVTLSDALARTVEYFKSNKNKWDW
jgi:nucleoside-diphosphate-sugar epimerase